MAAFFAAAAACVGFPLLAQQPPPPPVAPAAAAPAQAVLSTTPYENCKQNRWEQIEKGHYKFFGAVECKQGDLQIFADTLEYWSDTHKVVATGNVTFKQKDAQISADRADLNTETRLGTFYNAAGFAIVAATQKKDAFGGQEPDVYFYGDTIEKVGYDRYRITHGGFTTCVQPTPRWQITSGSVTLRLEHYAFLKNALLKAKGIPVFYLPAVFYPLHKDDRATGFLLPTYGTSTLRGFTLSNAFFWAINRSQDATFMHDWYSNTGQGMGAEYRYASGPGSSGNAKFYLLNQHEALYQSGGVQTVFPASKSYEIRANATQAIGRRWSARGRVDYFTDITVQQAYNTDIYDASRSTRTYGGSINGTLAGFTLNGAYDRTEYFFGTDTTVTGGTPRVTITRNEQPLFGTPVYFTATGEYANLVRESHSGGTVSDRGLMRLDFMPTIRVPFTKLQFLTVNSSVSWRGTYWTRSQPADGSGTLLEEPITRTYFDFQSRVTGPIVNRVWNTPDNGYAEKWKHTVEPYFNVQRLTPVDNFNQIVALDGTDYILGGTTRLDYGITNRLLAKRKSGAAAANAREILGVTVSQTYYSDDRASQFDYNYSTSFSGRTPSNFSPIRVTVRASPGDQVNGNFRLEYDRSEGQIQSIAADGQVAKGNWLQASAGFSQRHLTTQFASIFVRDNFVNAATTLRTPSNRVGGSFTFNYDLGRSTLLTSRLIGYYNAQCCGFAVEYQTYNFPEGTLFPVKSDRRFNFSFTLAGLGTFSNFFGALGGSGGMR